MCFSVAEEEAHRKWHCSHRVPRRKHALCTRHDCLQLSPRLHCGPSCQPVLEWCSLQGKCCSLTARHAEHTYKPIIFSFLGVGDSPGWRPVLWPGSPKSCRLYKSKKSKACCLVWQCAVSLLFPLLCLCSPSRDLNSMNSFLLSSSMQNMLVTDLRNLLN